MLNTKRDPADNHSLRQSISEWRPGGDGAIREGRRRTPISSSGAGLNKQWRLKLGDHKSDWKLLCTSVEKL